MGRIAQKLLLLVAKFEKPATLPFTDNFLAESYLTEFYTVESTVRYLLYRLYGMNKNPISKTCRFQIRQLAVITQSFKKVGQYH